MKHATILRSKRWTNLDHSGGSRICICAFDASGCFINDTRGSVIALDGLGRELQEPENAKRVVTFHRGPCPAFPVVEYSVVETQRESVFAGYLSRFVKAIQSFTQLGRHRGHGRRERAIS